MDDETRREATIEIARIVERGRIIRTIVVSSAVVCGIITITVGYIISTKPAWLQLILAIVAALIGPSGVVLVLLRTRQRYIAKHHDRNVRLEKLLDPKRESSVRGADSKGSIGG